MRREVEMAINEGRNIIPLSMEDFDFNSSSSKEALFGKLENLSSYNSVGLVPEYFNAGMEKLRSFLDIALEDVRLPILSPTVEQDTEKQQVKASEEPIVQKESLTVEGWFERGVKSQMDGNHKEAIHHYEKSLELNSTVPSVYNNIGIVLFSIKDYEKAKEAYKKSIELESRFERA